MPELPLAAHMLGTLHSCQAKKEPAPHPLGLRQSNSAVYPDDSAARDSPFASTEKKTLKI